ncbi:MAG: enoyl-CoA hydratase/isomerase family protein [Alphaproteobacteria bacterium]|nr:enoyl-CoA hydratase/isomerase family protein [Alphaproteobacteria bacterium]
MQAPLDIRHLDGIAIVTLNRPAVLNAIDRELRLALTEALRALNAEHGVRAIVLTGAGERAFTAGQDLAELAGLDAEGGAEWLRSLGDLYQAIRDLDKGCVVALNGLASGAGLQIAGHADMALAHPDVRLGQPEIDAGLPSVLGPWIMRQAMGLARAQEMSLSARFVTAEACLHYGLVNEIVPRADLVRIAIVRAATIGAKPKMALRLTKQRFRQTTQASWDATVAAGVDLVRQAFATGEPQRVGAAFLARAKTKSRQG